MSKSEYQFDTDIPLPANRGGRGVKGDLTKTLLAMKPGQSILAAKLPGAAGKHEAAIRSAISQRNGNYPGIRWLVRMAPDGLRVFSVKPDEVPMQRRPRKDFSVQLLGKDGSIVDV